MKIKCKYKDLEKWHKWYAWYPVWVDNEYVWLEMVERKVMDYDPDGLLVGYRRIK